MASIRSGSGSPSLGTLPSVTYSGQEFIPGHYCRDCGWPFTSSQKRTVCQVPAACQRRQALPLHERGQGCPYNDRVHPEWRALHSSRTAAGIQTRVETHSDTTATAPETRRSAVPRRRAAYRGYGHACPHDNATVRVVSWNVNFRGAVAARRQGELLRALSPDLILLQEVNPRLGGDLAGGRWRRLADPRLQPARPGAGGPPGPLPRSGDRRPWPHADPHLAAYRHSATRTRPTGRSQPGRHPGDRDLLSRAART